MKRTTTIVGLVAAIALLGACTLPAPAANDWKVKPVSIKVIDDEDNDGGDEPYVIQIGFRSKLNVPNSSSASIASQCYAGALPAPNSVTNGTTSNIPAGSADISFPNAQNLDIGDVLLKTAPLEIFGTMSFVMERDGLFDGCAMSDALGTALVPVLAQALNTLLGNTEIPPTQEQLIALLVDNLGNFLGAAVNFIGAVLEGLGNPDDIIGVAMQIHLPTAGAFTDLMNTAFALAGIDNGVLPIPDLPASFKFRIGHLLPSSATFDFPTDIAHYQYTSSVGG